ncbi:MAG: glycogen/starch synthase [Bacteroidales bacterium]|nr:glycogen/starch synthase [Bacteroidales bacterium]
MEKEKILFVNQEIVPYLPENKISLIGRYLPQGIQERGKEIRTFMPRFGNINERRNQLHEVIRLSGMNMVINNTDHPLIIKVASIQSARMQVYFIDNEDFFKRKFIFTDDKGHMFPDNDERCIFYARGVLETVKKLRWAPDIIHCHGWFSALVPLYVKMAFKEDPIFDHSKVIFSIYDQEFKEMLNPEFINKVPIDDITKEDIKIIEKPTYENIIKLAIQYSDAVILADENINKNILNYINEKNIKVLANYDSEKYIDAYADFYDSIIEKKYIEEF